MRGWSGAGNTPRSVRAPGAGRHRIVRRGIAVILAIALREGRTGRSQGSNNGEERKKDLSTHDANTLDIDCRESLRRAFKGMVNR